jgi:uncharacterized tellurite resistance protein B-like protein
MTAMQDRNLDETQLTQLTQAMISVATIDGILPAEAALIGRFYEASRGPNMPTVEAVMARPGNQPFDTAALAGSPADFADTLVLMCLMTGYADGNLTLAERAQVQSFADAMRMDAARFSAHLARVQDDLVGALSHLPDAGSVANVVRELGAGT